MRMRPIFRGKLETPPLLYDLTSLQRDANRILGFTAQQTLDFTQSLYEKKLVTYPRTDSRHLTDDMQEMLPALIASVAEKFGYAGDALRTDPVHPASVFDSSKVSDHHAIKGTNPDITYLIKFVDTLVSSWTGNDTPAAVPASFSFRSHAMFRPRYRIVCSPSASCLTSSGVFPCTIFQ